MLAASARKELMQSPFCRASVANQCNFESACLRKLFIWMLEPSHLHVRERAGRAESVCSEDR